jgi:hypothetical protein
MVKVAQGVVYCNRCFHVLSTFEVAVLFFVNTINRQTGINAIRFQKAHVVHGFTPVSGLLQLIQPLGPPQVPFTMYFP